MQHVEDYVIYVDEHIIVCNKPPFLLSVPGRLESNKDCLISRIQTIYKDALIVHRLDYETSGIIVLARNKISHRNLSMQFQDREVRKVYVAKVIGEVLAISGFISLPLRYDEEHKPRHIVDFENGKQATTFWQKLCVVDGFTRILLKPITGRSHQLRVHMQSIGFPIVGDSLYATNHKKYQQQRLHLHAYQISFLHPATLQAMFFSVEATF